MLVNRNMDNGFRPCLGQKVRVVGRCHKNILNVVGEVTETDEQGFTIRFIGKDGEELFTSGYHGGLEPINQVNLMNIIKGERRTFLFIVLIVLMNVMGWGASFGILADNFKFFGVVLMCFTFTLYVYLKVGDRIELRKYKEKFPNRYLCERCGGMGKQQSGYYNCLTKKYDAKAGVCDDCEGKGYLGIIENNKMTMGDWMKSNH